ncbi:MAG TPA: hypothetical protein PLQ18_02035, partial [Plasticicumulans sp.]|nr:hypothetical protein [Plasticicumulans sp.]
MPAGSFAAGSHEALQEIEAVLPAPPAPWRENWRHFRANPGAFAGLIVIVATIVIAIFAPYLAPYPDQGRGNSNMQERLQAPSGEHIMGTDQQGRDVLSRVMFGARIPLII